MSPDRAVKGWGQSRAAARKQLLHLEICWHLTALVKYETDPTPAEPPRAGFTVRDWIAQHREAFASLLQRAKAGERIGVPEVWQAENTKPTKGATG